MNKTGHGRWGRFRTFRGEQQKLCNGPLHPPEGAWLHLQSFWIYKSGPRKGKPLTQCIECRKTEEGRDPKTSGLIPVARVWWIFEEIQRRVGKAEACRRIGISYNMWYRVNRGIYVNMRRGTARKAILALHELRQSGTVRHRKSIIHGASRRGRKERIPTKHNHFYNQHDDHASELKKKRGTTPEQKKKDRERKKRNLTSEAESAMVP